MSASGRRFWAVWAMGLLLWISALLVAAPWDLDLSKEFADPSAPFGRWVLWFGEWPSWILVIASLVLLLRGRRAGPRLLRLRPLAWGILILAVVHPLLITQSLKFFWGRVRFRNLGVDFAGFTQFYLPAGVGAGWSFPSGHVAMAAVFNAIPFFLLESGRPGRAGLTLLPISIFVTCVAWGRILAGAHYLTDCLFSAGLSLLLAAALMRMLVPTTRPSGDAD